MCIFMKKYNTFLNICTLHQYSGKGVIKKLHARNIVLFYKR